MKKYEAKNIMLTFLTGLLLVFASVPSANGASQSNKLNEKNLSVPSYAIDVRRHQGGAYYSGAVGFKADIKYPQKTVIEFYSAILKNKDWTKCDQSDWDEFFDANNTIDKGFWTRRFASFFYDSNYDQSILVVLMYNTDHDLSITNPGNRQNVKWPDLQTVSITIYNSNQNTIDYTIKTLSLKCKKLA